ncbi:30S ribosomal protein S17 [Candidatus Roizmanbacteria bacterium RIFCSPHIGHO2_12_FULL_33_9]|uniref:Small ribosomal subunit protein uS17 n=1 Tax=Candidatus Roizmanbacteria bacterium RIFCSPHIGHO2_12_FULL_33_9 TaxID=1802045 RepID=A0A1F7HKG2_9BACT|nr:MAG: 30S ribosomal protein S17 [Candidatus Roizmanbacteria bacterium RIFCSPHIGHO2_12_FULL_33_9]
MSKILTGIVISTKTEKTVIVMVEQKYRHPMYQKVIKRSKKFKVHIADIKVENGDIVLIEETRPISKDKHFIVIKNLKGKKVK